MDSGSSQKRKLSKDPSARDSGNTTEDYVASKRRKEKADDKWTGGGGDEEDGGATAVTKEAKREISRVDGEMLIPNPLADSKSRPLGDSKIKEDSDDNVGLAADKEESESTTSRVGSKRKSEKDSGPKKVQQNKDSEDDERGLERERKILQDVNREKDATGDVEAGRKQGEERQGKRGRENAEREREIIQDGNWEKETADDVEANRKQGEEQQTKRGRENPEREREVIQDGNWEKETTDDVEANRKQGEEQQTKRGRENPERERKIIQDVKREKETTDDVEANRKQGEERQNKHGRENTERGRKIIQDVKREKKTTDDVEAKRKQGEERQTKRDIENPESNTNNKKGKCQQSRSTPCKTQRKTKPKKSKAAKETLSQNGDTNCTAFRSSFGGIMKLLKEVPLRDCHKEVLKKTPFWSIFESIIQGNLSLHQCRKSDKLIIQIVNSYNPSDRNFHIGGQGVNLTREDINYIFGLTCGEEGIRLKYGIKDDVEMVKRRSLTQKRLTTPIIKDMLKQYVIGESKDDVEDVARLLCLYLCHTLFFPNGTIVKWGYLALIEDLGKIMSYDWSGAILKEVMASVEKNYTQPKKITGCTMALLYWLFEHTCVLSLQYPEKFPAFLKWNVRLMASKMKNIPFQTDNEEKDGENEMLSCDDMVETEGDYVETSDAPSDTNGMVHDNVLVQNDVVVTPKSDGKCGFDFDSELIDEVIVLRKKVEDGIIMEEQYVVEIGKRNDHISCLNETISQLRAENERLVNEMEEMVVHSVTQWVIDDIGGKEKGAKKTNVQRSLVKHIKSRHRVTTELSDYVYPTRIQKGKNANVSEGAEHPTVDQRTVPKPFVIKNLKKYSVHRALSKGVQKRLNEILDIANTSSKGRPFSSSQPPIATTTTSASSRATTAASIPAWPIKREIRLFHQATSAPEQGM